MANNNNFYTWTYGNRGTDTYTVFGKGDYIKASDFNNLLWQTTNASKALIEWAEYNGSGTGDIHEDIVTAINAKVVKTTVTNATNATNAINATNATNAGNVTTSVGGRTITDIFETDSSTVKKATGDASGNNITSTYATQTSLGSTNTRVETLEGYFTRGVANSATKALKDGDNNTITSTYATQARIDAATKKYYHKIRINVNAGTQGNYSLFFGAITTSSTAISDYNSFLSLYTNGDVWLISGYNYDENFGSVFGFGPMYGVPGMEFNVSYSSTTFIHISVVASASNIRIASDNVTDIITGI